MNFAPFHAPPPKKKKKLKRIRVSKNSATTKIRFLPCTLFVVVDCWLLLYGLLCTWFVCFFFFFFSQGIQNEESFWFAGIMACGRDSGRLRCSARLGTEPKYNPDQAKKKKKKKKKKNCQNCILITIAY